MKARKWLLCSGLIGSGMLLVAACSSPPTESSAPAAEATVDTSTFDWGQELVSASFSVSDADRAYVVETKSHGKITGTCGPDSVPNDCKLAPQVKPAGAEHAMSSLGSVALDEGPMTAYFADTDSSVLLPADCTTSELTLQCSVAPPDAREAG